VNTSQALREAAQILGSTAEARTLLAHVLQIEPSALLLVDDLDDGQLQDFHQLERQRSSGIPLQYLTGKAYFRNISVEVGPGVFIPRTETEVMTGWFIGQLTDIADEAIIVELCAGSGAISKAIAQERPGYRQYAVEIDPVAFEYAERNLAGLGVILECADMANALTQLNGEVAAVIANPPYVPERRRGEVAADVKAHEPQLAVFSGEDGLDAIRVLVNTAARLLARGGVLVFEHDDSQTAAAASLLQAGGFTAIQTHPDLTGRSRFTSARTPVPSPIQA
jgi:release factor glutamine methyltransferase